VIGALGFPWLSRRLSATAITASSVLLLGVGWMLVGTANGITQVLAGVLLGGIGVGMAVPNLNYRLAALAAPTSRGRVLGTLVAAIFLGQFLSPLVAAPVIDAVGIPVTFLSSGLLLTVAAAAAVGARTLARRRAPATS
jgi:MFS family permease